MPLQNIGLAGRAGSGKGVLAAELVKRGYAVVSFARPLKIEIGRMFLDEDSPTEYLLAYVGQHKEVLGPLMQEYGEACRNLFGAEYWVNFASYAISAHGRLGVPVVVDDVRFPNEVAALKAAGFATFRIERPDWHRTLYGGTGLGRRSPNHSSEAQIDDLPVDHVLVNDTTPAGLLREFDLHMRGTNG